MQGQISRTRQRGTFGLGKGHLERHVADLCTVLNNKTYGSHVCVLQADHGPCTRGADGPTSILGQGVQLNFHAPSSILSFKTNQILARTRLQSVPLKTSMRVWEARAVFRNRISFVIHKTVTTGVMRRR